MESCPCGSKQSYEKCCGRYLDTAEKPPTAESLMRSRYVAFTQARVPYLYETCAPEARTDFDEKATRHWASQSKWLGLKILKTEKGQPEDSKGMVEFTATFELEGQEHVHHEIAQFKKSKDDERWYFVDGSPPKVQPLTREADKVGRNDPCPCGSGKKYKKCHG